LNGFSKAAEDAINLRQGPVAGTLEHSNELLDSLNFEAFCGQLSVYYGMFAQSKNCGVRRYVYCYAVARPQQEIQRFLCGPSTFAKQRVNSKYEVRVSWLPACRDVSKAAEELPPLPTNVTADSTMCDSDL
jgi:hypothetical protein